jgi:uncharacterized membrane protein YdbT with pleckstrin-like domain
MSYVERVLQPGETIRHTASIHWIVYWPGALCLLAAIVAFGYGEIQGHATAFWGWVAALLAIVALFLLVPEWGAGSTTEIAVTDRRIIFKRGFIRRYTIEMHLDKVESVDVEQSILGRIFNFGDIIIRGVGVGIEPLHNIDSPIAFRNHVTAEPISTPSAPAKAP